MSLYHFDISDQFPPEASEGVELATVDLARRHALRCAGRVLADQSPDFWGSQEWVLTVSDARHLTLFTITVFPTNAAASPAIVANDKAPRHPGPPLSRGL
jgi:hypothetical protein